MASLKLHRQRDQKDGTEDEANFFDRNRKARVEKTLSAFRTPRAHSTKEFPSVTPHGLPTEGGEGPRVSVSCSGISWAKQGLQALKCWVLRH